MKIISEILFIISNGLLIPVILLLLYFFAKGLWILAGCYSRWWLHNRVGSAIGYTVQNFSPELLENTLSDLADIRGCAVIDYLSRIVVHKEDRPYCEYELADFQVEVQGILSRYRILIKIGPMLGLMGTLIPMGPALVGLAVGDIASMAYNMQVAFATTVVGMLVAGIGLLALQLNQRFYARCLNDLEFITRKIIAE